MLKIRTVQRGQTGQVGIPLRAEWDVLFEVGCFGVEKRWGNAAGFIRLQKC